MKVVVGLGNPGPRYDDTRHNVGWWAVDRIAYDWDLGALERQASVLSVEGRLDGESVRLAKPLTHMNRSGRALTFLAEYPDFEVESDLLVIVDDASLDVGRLRLRPGGGAGGHNGLRSVEEALGTQSYARLRIGVGRCPEGVDMTDWVLSPVPEEDEERIVELLPEATRAVEAWIVHGVDAAMNRFNR